jgi:hypothetical protein
MEKPSCAPKGLSHKVVADKNQEEGREGEGVGGLKRAPPSAAGVLKLYPCLAWVQRERKAATNQAKFGAHFTQIVRFSALFWRHTRNG